MPEGLEIIEDFALFAIEISAIYIPKTVKSMGEFYSYLLQKIIVDNENPYYMDVDNQIVYNKNQTNLIMIVSQSTIKDYVMPDSVTSALGLSMAYAMNLTSISFNNNLFAIPSLEYNYELKWVEFKTMTPPPVFPGNEGNWLTGFTSGIYIYVPDSALDSYKSALGKYTSNIYPISQR